MTIAWIRDTLELTPVVMTENLLPVIRQNPLLEIVGGPRPLEFDALGNLVSVFDQA